MIEMSTKVDRLTAAVEALIPPTPGDIEAIVSLQASVRDQSQRVTASGTAHPTQATAEPTLPIPPAPRGQHQASRPDQTAADKPAPSAPVQFDNDSPSYHPITRKWLGNPAGYGTKHPRSYDAQIWRHGKYPDITEFHSPAPAAPGQPGPSSLPTSANVAAPDTGRLRKKNKG